MASIQKVPAHSVESTSSYIFLKIRYPLCIATWVLFNFYNFSNPCYSKIKQKKTFNNK